MYTCTCQVANEIVVVFVYDKDIIIMSEYT